MGNSKINHFFLFLKSFFLISQQKHVLCYLNGTVLMMGHNICFYGEICLIIPKLSLLCLLIWSTRGLRAGLLA